MGEIDSNKLKFTLFVDIGNSVIKAAVKKNGLWEVLYSINAGNMTAFTDWVLTHSNQFSGIVISSVRSDITSKIKKNLVNIPIKVLSVVDIEPLKLDYETPKTLGLDRYLGCLGAVTHSSKAVVVIDSGSACTIDYMSSDEVYMGGVIMPGLEILLNIFTEKAPELPPIEVNIPEVWPGKSTHTSLQWGQIGLFVDGINASLQRFRDAFDDFDLHLTGGDASTIEKLLKTEVRVRPYLVFEGMERMMKDLGEFTLN